MSPRALIAVLAGAAAACMGCNSGAGADAGGSTTGGMSNFDGGIFTCQYVAPGPGELCSTCTSLITECDTYSGPGLGSAFTAISDTCISSTTVPTYPPSCPTDNRIGCCAFPYTPPSSDGTISVVDCFYGTPNDQTAQLPQECDAGLPMAVWSPN